MNRSGRCKSTTGFICIRSTFRRWIQRRLLLLHEYNLVAASSFCRLLDGSSSWISRVYIVNKGTGCYGCNEFKQYTAHSYKNKPRMFCRRLSVVCTVTQPRLGWRLSWKMHRQVSICAWFRVGSCSLNHRMAKLSTQRLSMLLVWIEDQSKFVSWRVVLAQLYGRS